jgi:hypothetical protein
MDGNELLAGVSALMVAVEPEYAVVAPALFDAVTFART